jgi:hypothetical protein
MPNPKGSLKERLTRYRQVKLSVVGRSPGGRSPSLCGSCSKARSSICCPSDRRQGGKSVVEQFREKHRAKDVKKYYSKFDVAVLV